MRRSNSPRTSGARITGNRERAMTDWTEGEIRCLAVDSIGERYRRYRLPDAAAEAAMAGSHGPLWTALAAGGLPARRAAGGARRLQAGGVGQGASRGLVASGPAGGGGRADGQGDHPGAERDRRPDEGTGGGLDRPGLGARGRAFAAPGGGSSSRRTSRRRSASTCGPSRTWAVLPPPVCTTT